MAATDRKMRRYLVLTGLVPALLSPVFADVPVPVSHRADTPQHELRRQLRGKSYLLVQSGSEIQVWLFDEDQSGPANRVPVSALSDEADDRARWQQALIDRYAADPGTRIDALHMLADVRLESPERYLREALGDAERAVRVASIELLGEIGAADALVESWWQVPAAEHIHIVDVLGDIDSPHSSSFLKVVANSENTAAAEAASQYLEERN